MANLIQDNKHLEERLDSHGSRLYTLENLDKPQQPPPPLPSEGLSRTSVSPEASGSSQLPPPSPLLSTSHSDQSKSTAAPSSSKTTASTKYSTWTTIDTRVRPSVSSIPKDLHMDDDTALDEQVHLSDDEDIGNAHIPKVFALVSTYTPSPENSLFAQTGDMAIFIDWFGKKQAITELKPQDLEGLAFELVKVFHLNVIYLQYQMEKCHNESIIRYNVSKPLPLGGPPSQVKIESDFFFNKDLEYLRCGSKGGRHPLSILKMKATYYPDVGLEQRFYIDRHTYEGDRRAVRTHMRILSIVRIKVFSMYRYDYMKKIVLRRADLNEHIIAKRDFKYLYPSDFEDLYLLNLQSHLNHLRPKDKKIITTIVNLWTRHLVIKQCVEDFQLGIESYQTLLNFTKPRWDATGFEYKHEFPIDEALDYRVKEFKVNMMNLGLNTRFWTRKDVDRSKEFMFAIQKRLKTMRIFCNLESFVGGRVREGDYRLLQ
nr:hypothetical protein [Tanacetum cinerariifolium]